MTIEIVIFSINHGDFPVRYVGLPGRVYVVFTWWPFRIPTRKNVINGINVVLLGLPAAPLNEGGYRLPTFAQNFLQWNGSFEKSIDIPIWRQIASILYKWPEFLLDTTYIYICVCACVFVQCNIYIYIVFGACCVYISVNIYITCSTIHK